MGTHKYAIQTDIKDERSFSNVGEILQDLQRLQSEAHAFVVLEVSPAINNVTYIQAANHSYTKGLFSKKHIIETYTIELNITESSGLKHYEYSSKDFKEIEKILVDYIDHLKTPDYSTWTDVTDVYFG